MIVWQLEIFVGLSHQNLVMTQDDLFCKVDITKHNGAAFEAQDIGLIIAHHDSQAK